MTTINARSGDNCISGNHKPFSLILPALLLMALLATTASSFAADAPQKGECGTTDSFSGELLNPGVNLGNIRPFRVFKNASYGTGGVALRNRGAGGISISGVIAPVQAAYVYWAVIQPNKAASVITMKRLFPGVAGPANLPGVVVGTGPVPCPWPGGQITVFRALIPAGIAIGNGLYEVSLLAGAGGAVNSSDPWTPPILLPLWEGASVVMVGQPSLVAHPGLVSIYDRGLAGGTFVSGVGLAYNLILPIATPGNRTLIDNIGADGKHVFGASRLAAPAFTSETTTIGAPPFAGPGSAYWDSDWNGSSGLPVPELWDDTGHDITALGAAVPNLPVTVSQPGGGDCLTPVVNVIEED
jgi:hypothetical protein